MLLILPTAAIAALIYQSIHVYRRRKFEREVLALIDSGIRASDLEQWRSIDC